MKTKNKKKNKPTRSSGKLAIVAEPIIIQEMKKERTLLDEELRTVRFWNNVTKDEAIALRRIAKRKPVGIY